MNKTLTELEKTPNNRNDSILKKIKLESTQSKFNDLWAEEEEEDDDTDIQSPISQSRTVNSSSFHTQKVQ